MYGEEGKKKNILKPFKVFCTQDKGFEFGNLDLFGRREGNSIFSISGGGEVAW